jgi:predicted DNA-binding protein (UPF0251 family)
MAPAEPLDANALWSLECQLVNECGALRVPRWTQRWPWESRSGRGVGAKRRKAHRGVASEPPLIRRPERFLVFYGLERFAVGHKDGPALSGLLEYIGLTRRQREAFEMYDGLKIPQPEIAAALGVTQAAVSLRLNNARGRIDRWLAPLQAVQPKPYRSTTSEEHTGCAWRFRSSACRVCCQGKQVYGGVGERP